MNPITRIALMAAALAVALGATLVVLRPLPTVGPSASATLTPPSIEGTWEVTTTTQDLLDAGIIPHVAEDPDDYGRFHLTLSGGLWQLSHLEPTRYVDEARPYTLNPEFIHLVLTADDEYDVSYSVTETTLTFRSSEAPWFLHVKPWTRVTPEPIGTPLPREQVTGLGPTDVGKRLAAGTYLVDGFAAPFTIGLPSSWEMTELTETSTGFAEGSDGTVNLFMGVINKVYSDPCHAAAPTNRPRPVAEGVDALVTALSSIGEFRVSDMVPATLGGASGQEFRFTHTDPALLGCGDMRPFATHEGSDGDVDIAMFPGEVDRLWVLDANGTTVLIAVTGNQVDTVRPILETIRFLEASG